MNGGNVAGQAAGNTAFDTADRLAMINVLNSYGYFVDQQQLDSFFSLFTDAPMIEFWQGDRKLVEGWAHFKEMTTIRQAKFKSENIQRRHVFNAPRFDQQGKDSASGQVYLQLYKVQSGAASLITIGYYDFTLLKWNGHWRIDRWIARLDVLPD
jgi:SnoaL-like domain